MRRYRWMSAFRDPDCTALEGLIFVLADSVERGDMEGYAVFSTAEEQTLLDSGLAPILVLAAAEVFERAVARFVTSDQRNLLERFFQAARVSRQIILSDWIDRVEAAGA